MVCESKINLVLKEHCEFRFVAVPRVFEKMHSQLETQLDQVAHHHLWLSPCFFHHLTTILYLLWLRMYMLS